MSATAWIMLRPVKAHEVPHTGLKYGIYYQELRLFGKFVHSAPLQASSAIYYNPVIFNGLPGFSVFSFRNSF